MNERIKLENGLLFLDSPNCELEKLKSFSFKIGNYFYEMQVQELVLTHMEKNKCYLAFKLNPNEG